MSTISLKLYESWNSDKSLFRFPANRVQIESDFLRVHQMLLSYFFWEVVKITQQLENVIPKYGLRLACIHTLLFEIVRMCFVFLLALSSGTESNNYDLSELSELRMYLPKLG